MRLAENSHPQDSSLSSSSKMNPGTTPVEEEAQEELVSNEETRALVEAMHGMYGGAEGEGAGEGEGEASTDKKKRKKKKKPSCLPWSIRPDNDESIALTLNTPMLVTSRKFVAGIEQVKLEKFAIQKYVYLYYIFLIL